VQSKLKDKVVLYKGTIDSTVAMHAAAMKDDMTMNIFFEYKQGVLFSLYITKKFYYVE